MPGLHALCQPENTRSIVMYTEYAPSFPLSSYIDNYWEFKGAPPQGTRIRILPDGCTDFIFTLGEPANVAGGALSMQPYRSYFVGPMTKYATLVTHTDTVHMLGIRFLPCGVLRFGALPLHQLADTRLPAADLSLFFNDSLADALAEQPGIAQRIALIEKRLLFYLQHHPIEMERAIGYAVAQIDRHQGLLPIGRLASEINLCERQLERKFKQHTGFTPKAYSRIVQFRKASELLRAGSFDNLLSIAIEAGYYDVSHLSREIKKMSGGTPLSFLAAMPADEMALTYVTV